MAPTNRRDRGTALLEAAISLTLFLTLVFGIVGMGWAVYVYNQVSELAREGTRYAIVHGGASKFPATQADIKTFVTQRSSGLNLTNLTVTSTWSPDNHPGSVVKVQVQYSLSPLVPLIPQQVLTLQSSSQMVISQ